jgi:thiamine-phosphate pyrophosphorylase
VTRLDKLRSARLYFVCEAGDDLRALDALLDSALAGGVDVIQLRDKDAGEGRILEAAPLYRAAADRHGALFFLNDRPDLVAACAADGIHVGQDDAAVAEARALAGPDALVGLSTHRPEQLAAARAASGADRPDYVSVGPVWATPTKPGRPAAGLDYVAHAAANEGAAPLPWFAIGGIDLGNVAEVCDAGASRIVVVRAIRDAADPEGAAAELRQAIVAGEEAAAR